MVIIEFEIPEDINLGQMIEMQDVMKSRYDYDLDTTVTFNLKEKTCSFSIITDEIFAKEYHLLESVMENRNCKLKKIIVGRV